MLDLMTVLIHLKPTERSLSSARNYWEGAENSYKGFDVRVKAREIWSMLRRELKEVNLNQISTWCTSCGSHHREETHWEVYSI